MLNKPVIVIHFLNYSNLEVDSDLYEQELIKGLQDKTIIKVRDKRGEAIVINPINIVYFRIVDSN